MGIELFERVVAAGGQLLRVEAAPVGGRSDVVSALVLTFDLGGIAVTAEAAPSAVRVEPVEVSDSAAPGLEDAGEEEPWWRLLGNPIARVWSTGEGAEGSLCIQFRGDDQNPRVLSLQARNAQVRVRLETPPE